MIRCLFVLITLLIISIPVFSEEIGNKINNHEYPNSENVLPEIDGSTELSKPGQIIFRVLPGKQDTPD